MSSRAPSANLLNDAVADDAVAFGLARPRDVLRPGYGLAGHGLAGYGLAGYGLAGLLLLRLSRP
jgi:hypothetical protein